MTRRENFIFSVLTALYVLGGCLSQPLTLSAGTRPNASVTVRFTPRLTVRVYSFPGLSPWVLRNAEAEAAHAMGDVASALRWVDCTSASGSGTPLPAECLVPQAPADLVVRILKKALPQATAAALGINDSSDDAAAAFIFYDRVFALRSYTQLLPVMLGRVMAHEITHLLLPREPYSSRGLMKAQWTADDLRNNIGLC